ncbi:hypothetical protein HNY73_009730 [Argiope bruennichi]|uniref:Uncharacterized protein n=1 Tax=Argiope bruennichi TaxID=94029 RepID=A0A8T0FFI4_ARGBR|nr:hypothetical protein HNY73_009730 [Argiope bruennichi]
MPYQIFGKSFMVSSAKAKSCYRPENDFPEAYNISLSVMESTDVEEEKQRIPGSEDEMSRQENKWLCLNNDKRDFMDSLWTGPSFNCNMSEPRKLIVNPDFLPEGNESEDGKIEVSGYVTDEHTSLEMHSNLYSKSKKTDTNVKEHISSKTDNNAVVKPSGMCPRKRNFPAVYILRN